eukprot:m.270309 g.270309  ORF g.270309 m.270309 type:complete len:723 (+) comp15678_c0_seq2:74-2242(+)
MAEPRRQARLELFSSEHDRTPVKHTTQTRKTDAASKDRSVVTVSLHSQLAFHEDSDNGTETARVNISEPQPLAQQPSLPKPDIAEESASIGTTEQRTRHQRGERAIQQTPDRVQAVAQAKRNLLPGSPAEFLATRTQGTSMRSPSNATRAPRLTPEHEFATASGRQQASRLSKANISKLLDRASEASASASAWLTSRRDAKRSASAASASELEPKSSPTRSYRTHVMAPAHGTPKSKLAVFEDESTLPQPQFDEERHGREAVATEEASDDTVDETLSVPLELGLPSHLKLLKRFVQHLDPSIGLVTRRRRPRTFTDVSKAVARVTGRTFTLEHLRQIIAVCPMYKIARKQNTARPQQAEYHVVPIVTDPRTGKEEEVASLRPSQLQKREKQFHWALVRYVYRYHDQHLRLLIGASIPLTKLQRWDDSFDLENVPEVIPVKLSHLSPPRRMTAATALTELELTDTISLGTKTALSRVSQVAQQEDTSAKQAAPIAETSHHEVLQTPSKSSLKHSKDSTQSSSASPNGAEAQTKSAAVAACEDLLARGIVSAEYLAGVKAREQTNTTRKLLMSTVATRESAILARLPTVANTLRLAAISGRKKCRTKPDWCQKLKQSCPSIASVTMAQEHIDMLLVACPKTFQTIRKINGQELIRVNPSSLQQIKTELQQYKVKKEETQPAPPVTDTAAAAATTSPTPTQTEAACAQAGAVSAATIPTTSNPST